MSTPAFRMSELALKGGGAYLAVKPATLRPREIGTKAHLQDAHNASYILLVSKCPQRSTNLQSEESM